MRHLHLVAGAILAFGAFAAGPAHADGNVRCNAGPSEKWKPIAQARKKAWLEGWIVVKTQVEGDCYEIYAHTESGQPVEAFFIR